MLQAGMQLHPSLQRCNAVAAARRRVSLFGGLRGCAAFHPLFGAPLFDLPATRECVCVGGGGRPPPRRLARSIVHALIRKYALMYSHAARNKTK